MRRGRDASSEAPDVHEDIARTWSRNDRWKASLGILIHNLWLSINRRNHVTAGSISRSMLRRAFAGKTLEDLMFDF